MKVYIVLEIYPYEGEKVDKVFKNKKKASKYCKDKKSIHCQFEDYRVEEFKVE